MVVRSDFGYSISASFARSTWVDPSSTTSREYGKKVLSLYHHPLYVLLLLVSPLDSINSRDGRGVTHCWNRWTNIEVRLAWTNIKIVSTIDRTSDLGGSRIDITCHTCISRSTYRRGWEEINNVITLWTFFGWIYIPNETIIRISTLSKSSEETQTYQHRLFRD